MVSPGYSEIEIALDSTTRGRIGVRVALVSSGVLFGLGFSGIAAAQDRVVAGSVVSATTLRPLDSTVVRVVGAASSATTDINGQFVIPDLAAGRIVLDVRRTGYRPIVRTAEMGQRAIRIELTEIVPQLDTVFVVRKITSADVLSRASMASVSLSADELKKISGNSDDLVAYAKQLAGVYSGSDHVYVDGMPSDILPPADRIRTITINADPFSAEFSDGDGTHIDILTNGAARRFQVRSSGLSAGTRAPDGLNPSLSSSSTTASFGVVGPVPYLPLAFTADVHVADRRTEEPIEAVVPSTPAFPSTPVGSSLATDRNALYGLGVDYSNENAVHANASIYVSRAEDSNENVGGLTLPSAGSRKEGTGREFSATFTKSAESFVYRAGLAADWLSDNAAANTTGIGVGVPGAFTAGGALIDRANTQRMKWTFKNALKFKTGAHDWSIGATISQEGVRQTITPNQAGYIQFESLQDYVKRATSGAHIGTALVTRGEGTAHYVSYSAAPFVEGEILRRKNGSVRGGMRLDYQTGGGVVVSPRISGVAGVHGFVLRFGSGKFVDDWRPDIFLREIQDDGDHLRQYLITNADLSDIQAGTETLESQIVSKIGNNLTPAHAWVSKLSVGHRLGNLDLGAEYTWTTGSNLLGSQRLTTPAVWTDLLESNRALSKQQLHFRVQLNVAQLSLTGHYEWINARDNTDGAFSFPARQGDTSGEWGPSSGIARKNFTFTGNVRLGKATTITLVETWHGPIPVNLTSGLDVQGNGLLTDRAGLGRNSGRDPSYNFLALYGHRRITAPRFVSRKEQRMHFELAVQVLNLLGNQDYLGTGTVIGSPSFGRPLAAAPGRSMRIFFGL